MTRRVTRTFGKGADLLIIEDIPLISCRDCGEAYYTAETLQEIERVRSRGKSVGAPQMVTVAQLPITSQLKR